MDKRIAVDAFNLLCGEKIGGGIHRTVYECKIRDDLVVKVENEPDFRYFANVAEAKFHADNQYFKKVADWLAPVEFVSPDGRLLLMKRCDPIKESELPNQLPSWMTDIKANNFGRLNGRIVMVDYALYVTTLNTRLKKWR